jgi:hypothetical protein
MRGPSSPGWWDASVGHALARLDQLCWAVEKAESTFGSHGSGGSITASKMGNSPRRA